MSLQDLFDSMPHAVAIFGDFAVKWSVPGMGFGEFYFYRDGERIRVSNEGMSKEFLKSVLSKLVDDAELEDEPRAPTRLLRLTELYAYVADNLAEEPPSESVVAIEVPPVGITPLVFSRLDAMKEARPFVQNIVNISGASVALVRFQRCETLDVVMPADTKAQ